MRQIPLGTKGTFTLRVEPGHLANQFKDAILPQVLATPVMVLIMENAALNAIRAYLEPGESAVGTAIDVQHLAATPVGHTFAPKRRSPSSTESGSSSRYRRATKSRRSAAGRIGER